MTALRRVITEGAEPPCPVCGSRMESAEVDEYEWVSDRDMICRVVFECGPCNRRFYGTHLLSVIDTEIQYEEEGDD